LGVVACLFYFTLSAIVVNRFNKNKNKRLEGLAVISVLTC